MKQILTAVLAALFAAALFFVSTEVVVHQARLAEENAILQYNNAALKQLIDEQNKYIESQDQKMDDLKEKFGA
jgi:hypothetical protein